MEQELFRKIEGSRLEGRTRLECHRLIELFHTSDMENTLFKALEYSDINNRA